MKKGYDTVVPEQRQAINPQAEKIIASTKGLQAHLQPDELPTLAMPAIWSSNELSRNETCDVILTNRRLLGYYYRSFPREKLFLDALDLAAIQHVTFREENFSPVFREIMLTSGPRRVYIRTPRQKAEQLYAAIRTNIEMYQPAADTIFTTGSDVPSATTETTPNNTTEAVVPDPSPARQTPTTYGRQEIRRNFDSTPLGMTVLFVGGLLLEVIGIVAWAFTSSIQTGLPLFFAGLLAVITSIMLRRRNR